VLICVYQWLMSEGFDYIAKATGGPRIDTNIHELKLSVLICVDKVNGWAREGALGHQWLIMV